MISVLFIFLVCGKVGKTGGEDCAQGKEGHGEGHKLAKVLFVPVLDKGGAWVVHGISQCRWKFRGNRRHARFHLLERLKA